jgi:hypothetical protein
MRYTPQLCVPASVGLVCIDLDLGRICIDQGRGPLCFDVCRRAALQDGPTSGEGLHQIGVAEDWRELADRDASVQNDATPHSPAAELATRSAYRPSLGSGPSA